MFCSAPLFLKSRVPAVFFLMLMLVFSGCVKVREAGAPIAPMRRIADITVEEESSAAKVILKGSAPLTYTSVKQAFPLGVILYLPETDLTLSSPNLTFSGSTINKIITSKAGPGKTTSRIEIILKKDLPYEVREEGSDLTVSFLKASRVTADTIEPEKPAAPRADALSRPRKSPAPETEESPSLRERRNAPEPMAGKPPAATVIESVTAGKSREGVEVRVRADGEIREFKTFTIKSPPRIVYDLFRLRSRHKGEKKIPVNEKGIKSVRYYNHPDRFRMVIDTSSEYLSEFIALPDPSGLVIRFQGDSSTAAPGTPVRKKPSGKNRVRRIDLSGTPDGASSLFIETSTPVRYDMVKKGRRVLELALYNTGLSGFRYTPPATRDRKSAVTRITPSQRGNTTNITIRLRQALPYRVEQTGGLLALHFEPASVAAPEKPVPDSKASKSAASKESPAPKKQEGTDHSVRSPENSSGEKEPAAEERQLPKKPKYTGEKVSLDFFETDIKNVFRILQTVSNKNFAIDKSVTGKVTMTLDRPVPWDQVLDLVLKMNQLGMDMDGDIVRIASLDTFRKEQELEQAKIKAELKSREQAKALEPLLTEYISINYSKAVEDVLPHVEKVITPERGKVSADPRNNQIIITDIADKLKEARRVIREIDKVTPQVMISARIIEVTDDFSKDLGIDWSASVGPVDDWKDNLGGDLILDSTFNFPTGSSNGIGVSFNRIAGTPFVLNAKLTALEEQGEAKIISSPKIITLDNKKAMIKQGFEVPYLERDESGSSTAFKQVDLLLEVTPHVTPDQRVSLDVNITKNDVSSITTEGQPVLSTNQAQTTLLVNDGNTIVIGGILKSTKTSSQRRFPGLHKLPYLGGLFKSNTEIDDKTELMIFITPRIIQLEQRAAK